MSLLPANYFGRAYFTQAYFGLAVLPAPASLSLSVNVSYVPDPSTSALEVTEIGDVFGPFADSVSGPNSDGTYTITMDLTTTPTGLVPGEVSVQPGDLIDGVFTANGLPVTGVLSGPNTAIDLDWDAALDAAVLDITSGQSFLQADGIEYLHMRWLVQDAASGTTVTLTGNASVVKIEMAVTQVLPLETDWQTATLITRDFGDSSDGEYSVIKIGAGTQVVLTPYIWQVFGRLTTTGEVIVRRAPGFLTVQEFFV